MQPSCPVVCLGRPVACLGVLLLFPLYVSVGSLLELRRAADVLGGISVRRIRAAHCIAVLVHVPRPCLSFLNLLGGVASIVTGLTPTGCLPRPRAGGTLRKPCRRRARPVGPSYRTASQHRVHDATSSKRVVGHFLGSPAPSPCHPLASAGVVRSGCGPPISRHCQPVWCWRTVPEHSPLRRRDHGPARGPAGGCACDARSARGGRDDRLGGVRGGRHGLSRCRNVVRWTSSESSRRRSGTSTSTGCAT